MDQHNLEKYTAINFWLTKGTINYFEKSKILFYFQAINRTLLKWLKLWDKTVFGKGQDKKSKLKPEQMKKQKLNSAKNFKKQQTTGVQDEADWNVSIRLLLFHKEFYF